MLLTRAGKMAARYILHLDVTALDKNNTWKAGIKKCLRLVEQFKLSSISFPALGTGD